MALPVNIDDLINHRKVEWARIEYKEGWNPERVLHTLCAFANDIDNWGGGYVILGVAEKDGRPVFPVKGLAEDEIDAISKDLLEKCHLLDPVYMPVVEPVEFEGKPLMMIWGPGGPERPYKCPVAIRKDAKSEKAYYIRKMSSTVRASRLEEKELFQLAGDVPFDDRPNVHADVADLKVNLMADYLREVKSDLYPAAESMTSLDLARSLRLVAGPDEMCKPINAGLLFFNPHPENFFRCARIEVVDKPDPTGQGMSEKTFSGPLHIQLREALAHIKNYVLQERIFKHDDRAEADRFWNYPYRAVEEALANAVYHKSYQTPEPIVVTITPEQMEISSLPGPDRSISDEDLKNYHLVSKQYRNRRIGDFLKELDLVEGRNTGVPVIVNAMRSNQSPDPVFSTPETRAWFSVVLPVHRAFIQRETEGLTLGGAGISQKNAQGNLQAGDGDNLQKSQKHVGITAEEELSLIGEQLRGAWKISQKISQKTLSAKSLDRWSRIVQAILRDGLVTAHGLSEQLNATYRTIQSDMRTLKELNAIVRKGSDKGGEWIVIL